MSYIFPEYLPRSISSQSILTVVCHFGDQLYVYQPPRFGKGTPPLTVFFLVPLRSGISGTVATSVDRNAVSSIQCRPAPKPHSDCGYLKNDRPKNNRKIEVSTPQPTSEPALKVIFSNTASSFRTADLEESVFQY